MISPRFPIRLLLISLLVVWTPVLSTQAKDRAAEQTSPFDLIPAPRASRPVLRTGDRLAICGDSITEQRMYSRVLETYLTVCTPELNLAVRQYGWSGERADGFFERMENDVLRFNPTVATTCYGMNDHRYRAYAPWIGELYRIHMDAVVRAFQAAGARVVVGSPGCVGKVPGWVRDAGPTVDILNANLATMRNIAAEVAVTRRVGFADVFSPMWEADAAARAKYGTNYAVPGKDGVHPGGAGQLIMAYAFLDALGVSGQIGTFNVDLKRDAAQSSSGHEVVSVKNGCLRLRSHRYPFCAPPAEASDDGSIRSGMQWVPFQERLNRFVLRVKGLQAERYAVRWGDQSRSYSADELRKGINLAADFALNPFSEAFRKVDDAVAKKQAFETEQIKGQFHGAAGKADMEATVRKTEAQREPLVAAIGSAFQPVEHVICIQPE